MRHDVVPAMAGGMPFAACTTPANGTERSQFLLLLDAMTIRTCKRSGLHKRLKVLATDKG